MKKQFINAGLKLAAEIGFAALTKRNIAAATGYTAPLIYHYFSDMDELKTAIMCEAVKQEILPIIAQGLAISHRVALSAPVGLRIQAARSMVGDV
jgi:AcrR family transcriptional regulator